MRRKRNLEHLKNCPFCGNHELEFEDNTGDITCNACAYTYYDTSVDNGWWNSRPIEDSLTATIEEKDAKIERLQARVQELEEHQRWMPVREWKQDKDGLYVYEENSGLIEVEFFKTANQKYYSQHVKRVFCMPIPLPPKDGE